MVFRNFNSLKEKLISEKKVPVSIGDEVVGKIDDKEKDKFNRVKGQVKKAVSISQFEVTLEEILKNKGFDSKELKRAKNDIIQSFRDVSQPFDTDNLLEILRNPFSPLDLEDEEYAKKIAETGIPLEFITKIFSLIPQDETNIARGKGEIMLSLFTTLRNTGKLDLEDESGDIFEVKDNGNKSSNGFTIGGNQVQPGTRFKEMMEELRKNNININLNPPGNTVNFSYLEELHQNLQNALQSQDEQGKDILLEQFSKFILTYPDVYNKDKKNIDQAAEEVIREDVKRNASNDFRSFVGALQLYGYFKQEISGGIDNILIFYDQRGGGEDQYRAKFHIISNPSNFKSFFDNYGKKSGGSYLWAGGVWTEQRNSFKLEYRNS